MAKAIFKALLTLIANIVSIVMLPVNTVVSTAFPDLTTYINTFKSDIAWIVLNGSRVWNYFLNIFPSGIRGLISLYLSILVIKYTITISIHVIIKVFTIIKQIKIW